MFADRSAIIGFLFSLAIALAIPVHANDFVTACRLFSEAEVVFVGRAQPAVTRRISLEAKMEAARDKAAKAKAEVQSFSASGELPSMLSEHQLELVRKFVEAQTEHQELRAHYRPPQDLLLTPVQVETRFRGVATAEVFVWMVDIDTLEPGRSYVFYGTRAFGPLAPEIMLPSRSPEEIDSAGEALRFLNLAASGVHGTTVYGSLVLADALNKQKEVPLGGVSLRFSVQDQIVDTLTKSDGTFLVSGIPSGTLTIHASLPNELTIGERNSVTQDVLGAGCLPLSLRAKLNGRLRGTVFHDNGEPLSHQDVQLRLLGPNLSSTSGYHAASRTNEHGEFEFAALGPGSYLLGVNLAQHPTSRVPYPPNYFPGTIEHHQATPIIIGRGTEHAAVEWILNNRLAQAELDVFIDTDGEPPTRVAVCVITLPNQGPLSAGTGTHNLTSGPSRIPLVEGIRYRLTAHAETARGQFHSESVELVGDPRRTSLTLKATASPPSAGLRTHCGH